jgi:hypothetical protein
VPQQHKQQQQQQQRLHCTIAVHAMPYGPMHQLQHFVACIQIHLMPLHAYKHMLNM